MTTASASAGRGVWQAGQSRFNGELPFYSRRKGCLRRAGAPGTARAADVAEKPVNGAGLRRPRPVAPRLRNGLAHAHFHPAPGPRSPLFLVLAVVPVAALVRPRRACRANETAVVVDTRAHQMHLCGDGKVERTFAVALGMRGVGKQRAG